MKILLLQIDKLRLLCNLLWKSITKYGN